jgi:hypothetical protein
MTADANVTDSSKSPGLDATMQDGGPLSGEDGGGGGLSSSGGGSAGGSSSSSSGNGGGCVVASGSMSHSASSWACWLAGFAALTLAWRRSRGIQAN